MCSKNRQNNGGNHTFPIQIATKHLTKKAKNQPNEYVIIRKFRLLNFLYVSFGSTIRFRLAAANTQPIIDDHRPHRTDSEHAPSTISQKLNSIYMSALPNIVYQFCHIYNWNCTKLCWHMGNFEIINVSILVEFEK
jgi:hypothetical protein